MTIRLLPSLQAILCALLTTQTYAIAQNSSEGTILVVGFSKQEVILAVDSRAYRGKDVFDDDACKVIALNDQLLFSAVGLATRTLWGDVVWDSLADAREAAGESKLESPKFPEVDILHYIAAAWAKKMTHQLAQGMNKEDLENAKKISLLTEGTFVGFDKGGNSEVVGAVIFESVAADGHPFVNWKIDDPPEIPKDMKFNAFGEIDFYNELMAGTSDRAMAELGRLKKDVEHLSADEANVFKAVRYVELSIKYADHPYLVGGAVDVARLKVGSKTVEWIHRKNNCQ